VPWPALFEWIPYRVAWWVSTLRQTIPPNQRRILRIGRRGASAHAPENTIEAMVKAAELGADLVMLDLQHSRDGVPVVIHGPELSRTTDGRGPVSQQTVGELKKLNAGNGQAIPTLQEAIDCSKEHGLGLYLSLESDAVIGAVVDAIRRHGLHDRVGVSSHHPEWLVRIKALDPKITTVVLLDSPDVDAVALARAVGAQYIHPVWGRDQARKAGPLTPEWVREVHAAGLGIICEHEECLCDLAALKECGVDAICSSAPDQLRPRPG
jgi:glycerophosphoryl diester phosphodiesterase